MIFLPHTNTVILLELYCGAITEPGLTVVRQNIFQSFNIFRHFEKKIFFPSADDVNRASEMR